MSKQTSDGLRQQLNLETAQIDWHSLQRFFAAGNVLWVSDQLDLINVAQQVAKDNPTQVKIWLDQQDIAPVTDNQASDWYADNRQLWAVVIKPLVLVQQQKS